MLERRTPNKIKTAVIGYVFAIIFVCMATGVPAQEPTPAAATPEQLSATFAEVVKKVGSAVVSIDTKGKVPDAPDVSKAKPKTDTDDPEDILDFFERQLPRRPVYSVGSGFIVDKSGSIVTNAHVVEGTTRITVKLDSGEEFPATIVGADTATDIAILKIDAKRDLPFLKFGDSDKVEVGDWVLALGSPFGLNRTVTAGIVSTTKRETPNSSPFQKFIQTDAAINRGNSGGPLVNLKGEVIGVNSQIATSTGDYNGIGFALPAADARYVYDQIREKGAVKRGYIGIALESVKEEFARIYGLPDAKGAIVTDVRDPKSAAAKAGLKAGDVILEFNGQKIENAQDLIRRVAGSNPNETVELAVARENGTSLERFTASIVLSERISNPNITSDDGSRRPLPVKKRGEELKPFGLTLTEITPELAASYQIEKDSGLVVKDINPESFIADVKVSSGGDGIGQGDVIQRMNRRPVTNLKSFAAEVAKLKKGDPVVLQIKSFNPITRSLQLKIVQFTVE
jgi:serine protease Do